MRIIAGTVRGARLHTLPGTGTRPTLDRVRESIFSSLGDLVGAKVADLFAGTGSLGLEALSRGAVKAVFVENNRQALQVLRRNIELVSGYFSGAGMNPPSIILRADTAYAVLARMEMEQDFDVVFADPPYYTRTKVPGADDLLGNRDFSAWIGDALLVLEHPAEVDLKMRTTDGWQWLKTKRYGHCAVSFVRKKLCGR